MSDTSSSDNLIPYVRARGNTEPPYRKLSNERRREVFSDEDDFTTPSPSHSAQDFTTRKFPPTVLKKNPKSEKTGFSIPPPLQERNFDDSDDVEQELDLFSKAIHISNIDEIDHVGLMRGMHERFQRKQLKWQRYASSYSKWAFGINFIILMTQIIQMLFHQLVEVFNNTTQSQEKDSGYSHSRGSFYGGYSSPETDYNKVVFNSSSLRAVRCVLSAITAILAGFQMKLKLTEKSEKYRRGAKVYARLHRLSTYYLMLAENGGKIEDVTGLWRDAMKKEGKWIPVAKTFMAT